MRRRVFLAGLASATALSGCLGGAGVSTDTPSPSPSPSPSPTPEPTDSGEHPVTPDQTTFEVVDASCGQGRNAASVSFDGATVRVEGVIGGRDTCDTARLAAVDYHRDLLTVVVEVVQEEGTETVACGQCLTDIEYAFSATVAGDGPDQVEVVHRTAAGESTVTTADRP